MKVCLQMYSVREYMHSFPLEALHRCAKIYNFLEFPAPLSNDKLGIYYGHGIYEWKKEIERTGKKVIGGYLRTETDTWDASLDFASAVGMEYLIIHVDYVSGWPLPLR